jgi:tetratricopeptide (TPR) repeat protein
MMRRALLVILLLPALAHADGMGKLDFPTSCAPKAQVRFLSGMLALHSFEYETAREEFVAAQGLDAKCAMAIWGEAMSNNASLWGRQDTGAGREALAKAAQLLDKLPEKERAWLEAANVLFGIDDKVDKPSRETAYAATMRQMHAKWPDDDEVTAFFALSLMQASHPADKSIRLRMEAGSLVLQLFAKHPNHPGAAHYTIHAFDDPDHAIIALPAARAYAQVAPDASHARHMPSHIFVQLGMWDEAIASCESAWAYSQAFAERKQRKGWGDWHSKSWLVSMYLQEGRPVKAREALDAFVAGMRGDSPGVVGAYVDAVTTINDETGHWEDLEAQLAPTADALAALAAKQKEDEAAGHHQHMETSRPPIDLQVKMGIAYGHARAAVQRGDEKAMARAWAELRGLTAKAPVVAGEVAPLDSLKVDELLVNGLLLMAQKKPAAAAAKLEQAADLHEKQVGQEYFASPDRIPYEEYLGAAYLAAGKGKEARAAFQRALAKVPGRSRALLGAARAAAMVGDAVAAAELYAQVAKNWEKAEEAWPGLDEVRGHVAH